MPRRNHTPPHVPYDPSALAHTTPKKAYRTKQDADHAKREIEKYDLQLELSIYQSPVDGKWYLSSRSPDK